MSEHLGINRRILVIARGLKACRCGAAMFEFAIALPLLLIIFAGGWEMARGLWQYQMLNKGVRDAARYLARVDDPTSALSQTMALRLVVAGDIDTAQPPRIDHTKLAVTVGKRTFDNSAGTFRGPGGTSDDIDVIQVLAVYTFDAPLLAFVGIDDVLTLTVGHEERHIGD